MIPHLGDWSAWHAQATPERLALIDAGSGRRLTWRVFSERVRRLAAVLATRCGVGRGDRVAFLALNGTEVFEALFACLRLGATFVPLNWRLADPELLAIAEDARPRALIHGAAWAELAGRLGEVAPLGGALTVGAAYEEALEGAEGDGREGLGASLEDGAMILYTSGTTGEPKGVIVTWRQVIFNALHTTMAWELSREDRCLAFLPLFHTGGLNCLATPLLSCGGSVVILPRFDAARSLEVIREHGVTTTVAVPAMYQMLLDAGLEAALGEGDLRGPVLCGGAPCPPELIERYWGLGIDFRQGYGLTEVGPNCFWMAAGDVLRKRGSVGRPMPFAEARVVREGGAEAGVDEVGELWLRGPHVTAGYWGRPEATREVLLESGWFRTGDLVRRDAEGFFFVVGRQKEMFISGGENVYPAEVENALVAHPDVVDACVVGVPDGRWGEVGLAALESSVGLDEAGLRAWLKGRLAGYKVPKHWLRVEALPRNSSGKVIKAQVKALFPGGAS